MTTYNVSRFTRPESLRKIRPNHLVDFLLPYGKFLQSRGIDLS